MNHGILGRLGMMEQKKGRKKKNGDSKIYGLVESHTFSQELTYADRGIPKSAMH